MRSCCPLYCCSRCPDRCILCGFTPVWFFSSQSLLVTGFLRYIPLIILQGLTCVTTFLLLQKAWLRGPAGSAAPHCFSYQTAMALDMTHFCYFYNIVHVRHCHSDQFVEAAGQYQHHDMDLFFTDSNN